MRIKHGMKKKYKEWLKNNTDGYGRTCFVYAERWADMLEIEYIKSIYVPMEKILELHGDDYSHKADEEGVTGFMVGMSANILAQCWEFGKIFQKWWNKQYGVEDDTGVVNPAVLVIGGKND